MSDRKRKATRAVRTEPSRIVVARFESLPTDVYVVFRTDLRDPRVAAERKQKALGLKGTITAVVPYEVDSEIAGKVEQSVKAALPQFQFGKEALVRCSLDAMHRAIEAAFSSEPKQVALRFKTFGKQIAALEDQLAKLQAENARLSAQKAALRETFRVATLRERAANVDLRALRQDLDAAHRKIRELEIRKSEDEVDPFDESSEEDAY